MTQHSAAKSPNHRLTLAPVIWLVIVGLCLVVALFGVGYIPAGEVMPDIKAIAAELSDLPATVPRQAALAQSGVIMAITLALAITCVYWTFSAWDGTGKEEHRAWVLGVVVALFILAFISLLVLRKSGLITPFASTVGNHLLASETSRVRVWLASWAPDVMYVVACLVPAVLACGASFLLIPLADPADASRAQAHVDVLQGRFKEMDQLLYIGALTLVFGTLQLSAAMSVPLAGAPAMADAKAEIDLCKTTHAGSLKEAKAAASASLGRFYANHSPEQCGAAMQRMQQAMSVQGLRDVVKGITFSFGLAFSALLAAIYVPGAMVLRKYMEAPVAILKADATASKPDKPAVADIDPIGRIAAIVATLSPLLAGVLASVIPK